MNNINDWKDINLLELDKVKINASLAKESFDIYSDTLSVNKQNYKMLSSSEFLVPIYFNWLKIIDSSSLMLSNSISLSRQKIVRKALNQAKNKGYFVRVTNPINKDDFNRFKQFYENFGQEHHYELLLNDRFFENRNKSKMALLEIYNSDNEYFGGKLIFIKDTTISGSFRALARTKDIKEGFDLLCENAVYDFAVQRGYRKLTRGQDFNLKGVQNRSIGLLWNKLKWGYKPCLKRKTPRVYVDFKFLNNVNFETVAFISIENEKDLNVKNQKLNLNFICKNGIITEQVREVIDKTYLTVKVFDHEFKRLN